MISLQNVSKMYRTDTIETIALHNINLEVSKGEFLSVMGPSGCGKSTLLNLIGLIDAPTKGSISINDQAIRHYHDKKTASFRNANIGFIFQSFHLIPELNVLDNVLLPLLYRSMRDSQRRSSAEHALAWVGLSHRLLHYPSQLSGGQKQRVAIARAIVGNPAVILADEPTGNLDSVMGSEIMDILLKLNRDSQTTIVMVTHDEAMANKTHRLMRLFDGRQI